MPDLHAGLEPLARLRRLCGEIALGRYDQVDALLAMTGDETIPEPVRQLAEDFGMMLVRIEAREFNLAGTLKELEEAKRDLEIANARLAGDNRALTAEVDRLRIRIDVLSRDREVREISETDYFRSLQDRARALRERPR